MKSEGRYIRKKGKRDRKGRRGKKERVREREGGSNVTIVKETSVHC